MGKKQVQPRYRPRASRGGRGWVDDLSDKQLLLTYREMPTAHVKRAAVAFLLDRAEAYKRGPELEVFCDRRLAVIRKVLEERGELMPGEGFFEG